MNKKGFTLIEMLIVLLIIAIVMVVAIPAVRNLVYNSNETKYEQLETMVMEAIKLYVNDYRGELANSVGDCFSVSYSSLINKGYIEEEDIHCTGNIIVDRRENSGYEYELYLTCKNDNGKVVHETLETIPSNCEVFNGS